MTFEKAMMKLAEGRAVRHPGMNSRWHLVNSPRGVIQQSTTGAMLPYVACDKDHQRKDWTDHD